MKDFYYILGTDANCTFDEVKEAYRKLSKKFHPDLNSNDKYFEKRFREIQEAYETLIDPVKRVKYDADLKKFKSGFTNDEYKRQRYYSEQANNLRRKEEELKRREQKLKYQTFSVDGKSKTKFIDIGFTLTLIAITLIFGYYVKQAMSDPMPHHSNHTFIATNSDTDVKSVKIHKHKHGLKIKTIAAVLPKVSDESSGFQNVKPVQVKVVSQPIITPVAPIEQPLTVAKHDTGKNYLYTAYIKANMTGVVNMRQSGDFGADVIAAIPNNSKVLVLQRGNTYYKVLYNHDTGYVPKWTLDKP